MTSFDHKNSKSKLLRWLGIFCLGIAAIFNPRFVAHAMTFDGAIHGWPKVAAVIAFQAFLGFYGLILIFRSHSVRLFKFTVNLTLCMASLFVTLGVLEVAVCRNVHRLPVKLHRYLKPAFHVLAQSSKRSTIPENYIAIVGDSYAEGAGDWSLAVNLWGNPPYASHHLIHNLTGRDVISFGMAGAEHVKGIAQQPVFIFKSLSSTLLYRIPKPKIVLVYYYEGNDVVDNLGIIEREFNKRYDRKRVYDQKYFRWFIEETNPHAFPPLSPHKFVVPTLLIRVVENVIPNTVKRALGIEVDRRVRRERGESRINVARVASKEVAIPDGLQAPQLYFSEEEIDLSNYVFEQSLNYLRSRFPESKFAVVYIPSAAASYEMVSKQVSLFSYARWTKDTYLFKDVTRASNELSQKIEKIALRNDAFFIDTREDMRGAARKKLLHGPNDWGHLNQEGYTALSKSIVSQLKKLL